MLELVTFLCGAAVMVLEMAGSRLLAPHLGTSIVVWTGLIGVILASLSVGYWLGGRQADRRPRAAVLGRILLAAACFVALVGFCHRVVLSHIALSGFSLYMAVIVAAVALFCLPAILLGMVSPFIIRVKIALNHIDASASGAVIGRFSALSTIGSIVGTFLGGFVLISLLGTQWIVFSVAAALLLAAVLLFLAESRAAARQPKGRKPRRQRGAMAAAVIFCCLCALGAGWIEGRALARGLTEIDTPYNHIQVLEQGNFRYLITDPGKYQSSVRLDDPNTLAANYTRFFSLTSLYQPEPARVLMLGGGGYTAPRRLLYEADARGSGANLRVDVVEIDPGMTETARKYFFLQNDARMRIIHADARTFLNQGTAGLATGNGERYDVILLDTFNSHYAIPFHLCTREAMTAVHGLLSDTGVAAMNIIGSVNGDNGRLFRAIHAAVSELFPEVRIFLVHSPSPDMVQNILLLAAKGPARPAWHPLAAREYTTPIAHDMAVLTDDFAPVERYAIYD